MTRVMVLLILMLSGCVSVYGQGPFTVTTKGATAVRLGDHTAAIITDPTTDDAAKRTAFDFGFVVRGNGVRKEYAFFDDRLEFTFDFDMANPAGKSLRVFVPLPVDAEATITHGRTHPAPPSQDARSIYDLKFGVQGPLPPPEAQAGALFPLRYVSVRAKDYALSVDVHPGGAISEDPSYAELPLRMYSVLPTAEGIYISASLSAGYARFPGRIKGKIIFYADGRPFEQVHPFAYAAEYGTLEKHVALDFSPRPQRRRSDPLPFATEAYDAQRGYGWTTDPADLKAVDTALGAPIHGSHVGSASPGAFRADVPPGYYFVTLNFGSIDEPTGPMRVSVNGKARLERIVLDAGRYLNRAILVKAEGDSLVIDFAGLDGASWLLDGLTVEPLGTLNEDFVFTRPWWHFDLGAGKR